MTNVMLDRGYQVLFLDYRGTGMSTPVNAEALVARGPPTKQADYLKLFRADNIVRDCEAVRKCLTSGLPEWAKKWTIFGQSFGGFVSLAYLSAHPSGLRDVFITGGLAPLTRHIDDVYTATYKKVLKRNDAYYNKYPEDIKNVHRIAAYILTKEGGVPLPCGGKLTAGRLLSLGLAFGGHGGLDRVHSIILRLATVSNPRLTLCR